MKPASATGPDLFTPAFNGMNEKLLQYIWQFQYFNLAALKTVSGESVEIISPGRLNTNQGPDFIHAQIRVDGTLLAGSIELHIKTSSWKEHGHQADPNFKNVILHVVFENDLQNPDATIPVLELQPRISSFLIQRYTGLMEANYFVACANRIAEVKEITWVAWKERLLAERLTRKSNVIYSFLQKTHFHWEESFWWMFARNFGMKVNSDAFECIAQSVPVNVLAKHRGQIQQLEALLLGQAGLLDGELQESYPLLLQREYLFLKKKYGLKTIPVAVQSLRMRPGNFPAVRLAQLSALIHRSAHLFSTVLETDNLAELRVLFDVTANDYWHYHYTIGQPSGFKKKNLGTFMIDHIIINCITPMLFAYGLYHQHEGYRSKAIRWLEELPAEVNAITKGFAGLQLPNKAAYDSQAYIELKTQYCDHKHCLQCAIGNALLRNS